MLRFLTRRLFAGLATVIVASVLIFVAVRVLPGDVASAVLGRNATPHRLAETRAALGLNRSLPAQYLTFVAHVVTGRFGDSSAALVQGTKRPVWDIIRDPLRNSLILAVITMILFVPLCALLGTFAALRAGRKADQAISQIALTFGAMPEFLLGTLLVLIFFTQLHLLPPVFNDESSSWPLSNPQALIMPVLTLLGVSLAFGTRLLRASLIGTLGADYVAMARLNGLNERRVVVRFALRNALAPSLQILGQTFQYLLGGIIVTENVFNYPGIGNVLVQAVSVRDTQEVLVIAVILAVVYIFVNIVTDLAVVLLVPKLRTQL